MAANTNRLAKAFRDLRDSDAIYELRSSKVTIFAAVLFLIFVACALFAPWIAPHDPFDLSGLSLMDSLKPPAWLPDGSGDNLLGTDNQGRDMLSAIVYGLRISMIVGLSSVLLAAAIGVSLGLVSGYFGGTVEAVIMRLAEVQQSFPAILIALLVDGIFRSLVPHANREESGYLILILSIGLAFWVQYARTVRASVIVEREREYVMAARMIGRPASSIMFKHILINVSGPVLVIATINLALAIITESTLSFLGLGGPPTQPSLGTLIRIGNDFLFSGEWWIAFFPGLTLALLSLSVNLLGDWLRDALNPKLR